jgi:hypothetical protein
MNLNNLKKIQKKIIMINQELIYMDFLNIFSNQFLINFDFNNKFTFLYVKYFYTLYFLSDV